MANKPRMTVSHNSPVRCPVFKIHAGSGKVFLCLLCFFIFFKDVRSQQGFDNLLLDTLKRITASATPARHFAKMYYNAIEVAHKYAASKPIHTQQFIFGFESSFIPAFLQSYNNYVNNRQQDFAWQRYYQDTGLNELQYEFMGMNAHINGDMAQALSKVYDYESLKKYKRPLIGLQKVLDKYFDSMYLCSKQYVKLRKLHRFTLGLDRWLGKELVLKWRKRQVRLAMMYHRHPRKYERKIKKLQKRMKYWDDFALYWIK